ncbi:SDR family oxidoreductase [Aquihabitans sp. G128]|uniref:SDR family oxidoreductase n=1 Tax=Aquihabitans sp. G128 TaxID=2849779 RepID=UPI001C2472AE|nr:SDR family oxidoreductase [Aquihabitans sp. G128]QXC61473.1 SDR family oxidoreductase [Aquihabitans sp. G128]
MQLQDRVVVVTGAAKGIGRALATAFLAEGARTVVVADLAAPEVEATVAALGAGAVGAVLDVSSAADLEALVARVEEEHGPIDLFVSNAGIGTGEGLEASEAAWDRIWRVNVLAHVHAARAVLPGMLARGEGYLLSTASAAGLLTQIGDLPYSVTKHAAVSVAEWLAVTYGDRGITVSCLCPQGVNTDLLTGGVGHTSAQTVVAQGVIEPEEVAAAVVAGLAAEQFLILPHPEVAEYYRRRATDPDRWLAGMARLQARIQSAAEPG